MENNLTYSHTSDPLHATSPLLQTHQLSKIYDDGTCALTEVSFTVSPGQIYAMLGGNGAGKTTTINLFLNFIQPTSGFASICGIQSHKDPISAKENVAYVSENVQLYPNFNAIQNLDFFCKIGGKLDYTTIDYQEILLKVGLQEDAHFNKLRTYSKGMRQKCGIAIAMLKDTPAILLDEPTSGLDPKAGMEFCTILKELKARKKAILMSTHDIFRARDVADTIGILNQGRLVMEKSVESLKGENLEALYMHYMAGYMDTTTKTERV